MLSMGPFPRFADSSMKNIEKSWRMVLESLSIEDVGGGVFSLSQKVPRKCNEFGFVLSFVRFFFNLTWIGLLSCYSSKMVYLTRIIDIIIYWILYKTRTERFSALQTLDNFTSAFFSSELVINVHPWLFIIRVLRIVEHLKKALSFTNRWVNNSVQYH